MDGIFGEFTYASLNIQCLIIGSYIVEIIGGTNSEKHRFVIQNQFQLSPLELPHCLKR